MRLAWLALGFAVAGCGTTPPPTLSIDNPTAGATVTLGTDMNKSVSVSFTATHFTVKAACNGQSACGQVWLLIDGATCDPVGQTYDALAVASPATAIFATCPMPTGAHNLSLELHQDDGSPVKDATGQTISATVTFTTQ